MQGLGTNMANPLENYGAHEVLEVHEVLTNAIVGINSMQLYRPHCQDQQLRSILDNQLRFMVNEYNTLVNTVNMVNVNRVGTTTGSTYHTINQATPVYGLDNPTAEAPNTGVNQMNDRDVAAGVLSCHKASATIKMHAALECADQQLRSMMIQSARNCADLAYEVWTYMNQKGYYQVPTLKQTTMNTFINQYQPASAGMMMNTTNQSLQ